MAALRLKNIYEFMETLSLDIAVGACAGMLFFDRLIGADLRLLLYLLLGLAVWCIYTLDHLLDARQIKKEATAPRHAFHQRHFKVLALVLVISGSVGFSLAFYLLKIKFILFSGLAVGSLILLSFMLLKLFPRTWVFLKEISMSVFYVAGIMLAPYLHNDLQRIPQAFWLLGLAYVLVVWFNSLYLGMLDRKSDKEDGLYSFALAVGKKRSMDFLFGIMVFKLLYIASLYLILTSRYYLHISIILIIALIHCVIFLRENTSVAPVRRNLDASFMIPFVLLLV